jgi:hypothetical protein
MRNESMHSISGDLALEILSELVRESLLQTLREESFTIIALLRKFWSMLRMMLMERILTSYFGFIMRRQRRVCPIRLPMY